MINTKICYACMEEKEPLMNTTIQLEAGNEQVSTRWCADCLHKYQTGDDVKAGKVRMISTLYQRI